MKNKRAACICLFFFWLCFAAPTVSAMRFQSEGYIFNAVNETALLPTEQEVSGGAEKTSPKKMSQKVYKSLAPVAVTSLSGEELQFVPLFDKECIKLTSRSGSRDYLSFTVAEGEQVLIQEITGVPLYEKNPDMKCWAILTRNAKSGNVNNFWLVGGPVKDTYVSYVSLHTLAQYGFHYTDLRLDLQYAAILLRGGTRWLQPISSGKPPVRADAMVMELFWDSDAAWFGIKRIV